MDTEEIVRNTIFAHQFLQRLAALLSVPGLILRCKHLGSRKQIKNTDNESHETYRKE